MQRIWAMPSADTFDVPPIGDFVKRYLRASRVSIDPFARNKRWATHTNDLNPDTAAESHQEASAFLSALLEQGVKADCILFDPPYSVRQIQEVYQQIGRASFTFKEHEQVGRWNTEKDLCYALLEPGGVFLHFGWHTNGLGLTRGVEIVEILLVPHGGCRNDTICMAERKQAHQEAMAL